MKRAKLTSFLGYRVTCEVARTSEAFIGLGMGDLQHHAQSALKKARRLIDSPQTSLTFSNPTESTVPYAVLACTLQFN